MHYLEQTQIGIEGEPGVKRPFAMSELIPPIGERVVMYPDGSPPFAPWPLASERQQ